MSTPVVRHFLLSLEAEYDRNEPLAPYTLRNLLFRYRPPVGAGYPYVLPDLWMFALLVGTGRQEVWLEVYYRGSADADPDDETEPDPVAAYGPFVAYFGTEEVALPRSWHLRSVPFGHPGWYEFLLLHEGVTLAAELVYLEG